MVRSVIPGGGNFGGATTRPLDRQISKRLLIVLVGTFLLQSCAPSPSTCALSEIADVPVTFIGDLPTVEATVNGHKLRFMVDTGSFISSLTPKAVAELNGQAGFSYGMYTQSVGGRVLMGTSHPGDLIIGGLRVSNEIFSVIDLFKPSNPGDEIDGQLGADILSQTDFAFDFPHNRLLMFKLGVCPTGFPFQGQFADVPMHSTDEFKFIIPVAVDGHTIDTVIDSGSSNTSYDRAHLKAVGVVGTPVGHSYDVEGVGGKTAPEHKERFASVTIGAEEIDNDIVGVMSAPEIDDAVSLIGEDYLKYHQVYISQDTGKVWLGLTMKDQPP